MEMRIVMVDPHTLTPHSLHAVIYGNESIEALVKNIKEVGIQEPLIVTHDQRIISDRRWQCSGSVLVCRPCPCKCIPRPMSTTLSRCWILSNKDNRERTNEQKARKYNN
jgi:hypothetical protein